MDNRIDDVMVGWLARECRFYLGVNLCERSPIGYAVKRRCVVSKGGDDSSLMSWLSEKHGIQSRKIQDIDTIRKVIDILEPYAFMVKDIKRMRNMERAINEHPRLWNHDAVLDFIAFLEEE